jgi:flagellar hook protein FlgE
MYSAISGLQANQTMLDVVGNNLANVNTIGYKSSNATFADALTQVERGATGATNSNAGTNTVQVGLGTQLSSIDNDMSSGSLESTGNPLDVAIDGDGFLRVGTGTPPSSAPYTSSLPTNVTYTRAGDLTTDASGFLATQSGDYVIGRNAVATTGASGTTYTPGTTDTYINIPPGSKNVTIGQDGSVSYTDEDSTSSTYGQSVTAGYISLASFPNEAGLERVGGSQWTQTANSGAPTVGTPNTGAFGSTIGGELEESNVDMATEFTNMLTAQRGYEANSKVITTGDQMMQTVVQMVQG